MKKLIKLSKTHYIVVDDSEIKEGDYHVAMRIIKTNGIRAIAYTDKEQLEAIAKIGGAKKITHSTEPLYKNDFWAIKELKLSEVEEAIHGFSVEKMVLNDNSFYRYGGDYDTFEVGYKAGFKAHQELVKDKLFTIEDMRWAFESATDLSPYYDSFDDFYKTIAPKTEWDIEFVDGKIKLI